MPSPGFPTIISAEPWRLYPTSGSAWELYFDVPGPIQWQRSEEVRLANDPCGGPPTLLKTTSSVQPRRFRVTIRMNVRDNRDSRMSDLETRVAASGPYLLSAPVISSSPLTVLLIPEQGGLTWDAQSGARVATLTFQEA